MHYNIRNIISLNKYAFSEEYNNVYLNEGILVYCNTGQRARYASEQIAKMGYKKVYYIDGTYKSIM